MTNKWISISVVGVLVAGLAASLFLYFQESGNLKEAESDIFTLEADLAAAQAQVSTLETELTAAEAQVSTLEADLAAAQAQVSSLQADLTAAEARVLTLEGDLAAAEAQVLTLEADLADAEARVSALEAELAEEPTLRELASRLTIDWGTVIRTYGPALNDDLYENSIGKQFNVLVPENGMYMVDIQRIRGVWNFARMDSVVELAEANDMKVRGHTLIWGDSPSSTGDWHPTPDWFRSATLTREEAIDIMNEYIAEVISRYGSRVAEWVVVNEPIAWDGSGLMNNVWKNKIGADYVELAFRKADELAPDAILILNEFGANYLEENRFNTREETFYNYVRELVEKGVPIDAVGFEFHLSAPEESWKTEPTISKIVENFKRYGELGLDVYVTELDVRIKEPLTPEKLERQAELYAMVMEAVLMSQYSRSITVWGHTDRYSWINDPGRFPGYSAACLYDENHEPKPAYYAVIDVMKKYLD